MHRPRINFGLRNSIANELLETRTSIVLDYLLRYTIVDGLFYVECVY